MHGISRYPRDLQAFISALYLRPSGGDDGGMDTASRIQRTYDHRLKNLVNETGDIQLALERGVPRSTARGWLSCSCKEVVTLDVLAATEQSLQQEILSLRRLNDKLRAISAILIAALKVSGFSLANHRLPDNGQKARLLQAIDRSRRCLPFRAVLRLLRLSPARYHRWKRPQQACELDDSLTCPKTSPQQLTP